MQQPDLTALCAAIEASGLRDGGTVSFHHHLRDGDCIIEAGLHACRALGLKDLHLAASSLFPCHQSLIPLLQDQTVTRITTAYMNGPLAEFISQGHFANPVVLTTHGGRARMMSTGATPDLAILSAPAADAVGNLGGADGPWACGPLGYAMVDAAHAKHVLAVTPFRAETLSRTCIPAHQVSAICEVSTIGDSSRIESGTTARAPDTTAQAIAAQTVEVIRRCQVFRNGFNFQTGAGGASLLVAQLLGKEMAQAGIMGGFASGGITTAHVAMTRAGLFQQIKDVQAFDLGAVRSYAQDANHHCISAHDYANPDKPDCIAHQLDIMILGAAEVDRDFNVNVTTTNKGQIIGGSGGHSDTAEGAALSIVVVPTHSKGTPRLVDKVRSVSTKGAHVDIVVTEAGICINPNRGDLLEDLAKSGLPIVPIDALVQPSGPLVKGDRIVAEIHDRRGKLQDVVHSQPLVAI